ncbi:MAG: DUF58 domain-containing protein [Betaproteobacteria bacterium]|nr:DUF58 domain-containing protein [Betaproteobacteria bacterium]
MFKFLRSRKRAAPAAAPAGGGTAPAPAARPRRADPDALLRRLEWTVIRRLDGMLQGDYRNLLRGFGLDFADLREYQPHDDVRYIDWNVTARLQTPYVREFQEDREITAWFLLDLSGSVDFGSREVKKRELSVELVTVLARLLTRYGNRVGAVIYRNGRIQVVPPRGGRRQVLHLIDRMQRIDEQSDGMETDLAGLLRSAEQAIKRRSAVFIVSDFISTPGWERALSLLARRHEIVAARLFDPLELALPDLGFVVLQDAETGEQLFVDTQDKGFRERFQDGALRREAALRSALAHAGVDCLELATDDNLGEALLRFTGLRKRRSQLAAGGGAIHRQLAL